MSEVWWRLAMGRWGNPERADESRTRTSSSIHFGEFAECGGWVTIKISVNWKERREDQ